MFLYTGIVFYSKEIYCIIFTPVCTYFLFNFSKSLLCFDSCTRKFVFSLQML